MKIYTKVKEILITVLIVFAIVVISSEVSIGQAIMLAIISIIAVVWTDYQDGIIAKAAAVSLLALLVRIFILLA